VSRGKTEHTRVEFTPETIPAEEMLRRVVARALYDMRNAQEMGRLGPAESIPREIGKRCLGALTTEARGMQRLVPVQDVVDLLEAFGMADAASAIRPVLLGHESVEGEALPVIDS
jgi:hypothetical protein